MWESVKNCSSVCKEAGTCGWISRVAHGCKPLNWSTLAKHARSWSVMPAIHYKINVPTSQAVCLRLELATQPSREVKPVEHPIWQNMTFHIPSHLTIYIPLYPRFRESFQREFWEKNPREKQDWLIHNLHIRDSSNSSTLFLSIVTSLRGLLPKSFSHHTHIYEKAIWCVGSN